MGLPRISVVGAGLVGGAAALLIQAGIQGCEVVVVDIEHKRAEGQAMDIAHAGALWRSVHIRAGDYDETKGSDIVVITAGVAMKPGQTRLDLAKTNVGILKSIIKEVRDGSPDAIYVIATNPVDVLTFLARDILDVPAGRVISTGTSLDSARLRTLLSERIDIEPVAIQANVLGEHGDSSFIHWSGATVGGVTLDRFLTAAGKEMNAASRDTLEVAVRSSAHAIKEGKGATYYGIGSAIARICQAILHDEHVVMPVGMTHAFVQDIDDVCLSLPTSLSRTGGMVRVWPEFTKQEVSNLVESARILKSAQSEAI